MKTLRVHWRHRHVTEERTGALRDLLVAHPGEDEVRVYLTGSGHAFRLPMKVKADRDLCREIHHALDQSGSAFVVDHALLWP